MIAPSKIFTPQIETEFSHRFEPLVTDDGIVYGCKMVFDDSDDEAGQLSWAENELQAQLNIIDGWQWFIGDFVEAVRKKWSHTWSNVLPDPHNQKTIRSLSTIQYWTGVCRVFEPNRRRTELSPSHHAAVAFINEADMVFATQSSEHSEDYMVWAEAFDRNAMQVQTLQDYILELAVRGDWSVRDTKAHKDEMTKPDPPVTKSKAEIESELAELKSEIRDAIWRFKNDMMSAEQVLEYIDTLTESNTRKLEREEAERVKAAHWKVAVS